MKASNKNKPKISKVAFWDVNFDTIDFEASSVFVLDKILNYGTWADIIEIFNYYGLERVKNEVVEISYLKGSALSFLCLILKLKEKDFTAYQSRQSKTSIWKY